MLFAISLMSCACGGEEQDDGAGDDVPGIVTQACSLVSREEAAETLGLPVLEGVGSVDNFTDSTCQWPSEDDFGEISVEVRSGDPARFTEFYELAEGESVEGLGDRAKWDGIQGLEVLTSDYYVNVFTINFSVDEAELRQRSITLAQTVLDRLP